jgi:hypothetical protein
VPAPAPLRLDLDTLDPPFLTLDGVDCGFLREAHPGRDGSTLELAFGPRVDDTVFEWVNDAWRGRNELRDGLIRTSATTDAIAFEKAVITRTRLPALDAADKTQPEFELTLQTARMNLVPARSAPPPIVGGASQHPWRAGNFHVEIDRVATNRVSAIAAIRVACDPAGGIGGRFSHLRMTVAEKDLPSWQHWQQAAGKDRRRDGTLSYLQDDLKTEFGRLTLGGLRLLSIGTQSRNPAADQIARFGVSVAIEQARIDMHG